MKTTALQSGSVLTTSLSLALVLAGMSVAAASPMSNGEDLLFKQLADPAFYIHPHRREAIADALAVAETMMAATGSYQNTREAGTILHGPAAQALRLLAAGGGRAGEIARIMQSEAEKGLYGDPSRPLRGMVSSGGEASAEFKIPPGATQRLLLDSSGTGRLLIGATCAMELRELPRDENGLLDIHGEPGTSVQAGAKDAASYAITAPLIAFGVAPGHDCGDSEQTLLVGWSPPPPRLAVADDGKLVVRRPGRYQVDLTNGAAELRFELPPSAHYTLSVSDEAAQISAAGPSLQGQQWIGGGQRDGRIEADNRQHVDLVVAEANVPRLLPGEVLQPPAGQTSMLFEVALPGDARGYLRLESLPAEVDGDPMLYAFDGSGEEVAQDDDGGEGLLAALEVEAVAGSLQTFAVTDLSEQGLQPVRISLADTPLQREDD